MVLGRRNRERFWIALTVRIAFGFMFLIASMNIFFNDWEESKTFSENFSKIPANLTTFSDSQSKAYETTWINAKFPYGEKDPQTGATKEAPQIGLTAIKWFLMAMPFILLALSLLLLTGLFLRPALRLSAIYLVLLGLGKYLVEFKSGGATTMQDFLYAMFITLALFVLSKDDVPAQVAAEEYAHSSK
jgi:uncharacterized membrane protein YphA (DoxX/SURF4 family)